MIYHYPNRLMHHVYFTSSTVYLQEKRQDERLQHNANRSLTS